MAKTKEIPARRKPGRPKDTHRDNSVAAREFGFRLKRLRASKKLTQQQMAEWMGLDYSGGKVAIARWESGLHQPQKRFIDKLAQLEKV